MCDYEQAKESYTIGSGFAPCVQDSGEGFSNHLLQVKIDRSLYIRLNLMGAYHKKSVQALVVDWLSERADKEIKDNRDSIGKLLDI